MDKPYRVQVFGKTGCDKCAVLNQRLDRLLAKEAWQSFEKQYCDVETEEGLVAFCEAECINPQRIPAMLVTRLNPDTGVHEPIPATPETRASGTDGKSRLAVRLGIQTDYSEEGRGIISPRMIKSVLEEALA